MKTIADPVEMIARFDLSGKPVPVKFKHKGNVVSVQHIVHVAEERFAGNPMKIFRCQSEVGGEVKVYELKYEPVTGKWWLWKM